MREALVEAVLANDVAALAVCFADADLVEEVVETDQYIATHKPMTDRFKRTAEHGSPWYYPSPRSPDLFNEAVESNSVDVLAWLFSDERVALMPATLARVWLPIARWAASTKRLEILELLLCVGESRLLHIKEAATLLARNLSKRASEIVEVLQIVSAHGGIIHRRALACFYPKPLGYLVQSGAFVVGKRVSYNETYRVSEDIVRQRLELGMDAGPCVVSEAAANDHWHIVKMYISEGFADVDAADSNGLTALHHIVSKSPRHQRLVTKEELLSMARSLLAAGANVSGGKTASKLTLLHGAANFGFTEMMELLLEYGADPNAGVDGERKVLQFLRMPAGLEIDEATRKNLELLLRYGLDPNTRYGWYKSLPEMLAASSEGREFMQTYPQYFRQSSPSAKRGSGLDTKQPQKKKKKKRRQ